MKKFAILICAVALLLAFTGIAWGSAIREPIEFSIYGYTTGIGEQEVEGCKFEFKDLTAMGIVYGDLNGSFAYVEEGKGDLCDHYGTNEGLMTVVTDDGTVVIEFKGDTDLVRVWGQWELESGTGDYKGLEGDGTYFGDAGLGPFTVTFTGFFYHDQD